jgi:ribokinase
MLNGQKPIVVVGSINADLVTNAEHIPAAGETVHGSGFQIHPGGKGANQAVAVARLGYPVQMIGKIGTDALGQQLWSHLEGAGVNLEGVERVEGPSGTAVIIVGPGGENCIVVTPGANAQVTPECVDRNIGIIRKAGLVLTQLEIPLETVEHLAEICFRESVPLILDPAPARTLPQRLLQQVRWFTPNETEASFYMNGSFNDSAPSAIARSLLGQGPAGVILKMGARGAYLAVDGTEQQLSAMPVNAVDTTAAGDALNGAFAVGLMSGRSAAESVRFAVAAASFSVTRHGAQASMPTLQEVIRALDGHAGKV